MTRRFISGFRDAYSLTALMIEPANSFVWSCWKHSKRLNFPLLEKLNALPIYFISKSGFLNAPTPITNSFFIVLSKRQGMPFSLAKMAIAIFGKLKYYLSLVITFSVSIT